MAAIVNLLAVYTDKRYDFVSILGAVLQWSLVAGVALGIAVLHRRRKSPTFTQDKPVSKEKNEGA